jgi:plastocyanin
MTRRTLVAALAAAALGAAPATADPAGNPTEVNVLFQQFSPSQVDLLPGETVHWTNVSERRHTITADDGSFDSGDFFGGDQYSHEYDDVGTFPYHCRVHAGMVGEVDVRRVILDTLPTALIPAGQPVEFTGRTVDPASPVAIERDAGDGKGFRQVATVTPAADGTWKTTLPATTTADYRAALGADTSETRRLLVSDRKVLIRATRNGVHVELKPSAPYARVRLEIRLRERFGWWPAAVKQLDYISEADFRAPPGARVRVVMVDRDAWTPLATSRELRLHRT